MSNPYLTDARIIELWLTNVFTRVLFEPVTFQAGGEVEKLRPSLLFSCDGGLS